MSKVRLTLTKSASKRSPRQRATIVALGLGKTHSSVEHDLNPAMEGMINKLKHVLKIEQL